MTGKEIVDYIIQNNAWDKEFFSNGEFPGYIGLLEAAAKYQVGQLTIMSWCKKGLIDHIWLENGLLIHRQAKDPRKRGIDDEINKDICGSKSDDCNDDNPIIRGGGDGDSAISDRDRVDCRKCKLFEECRSGNFIEFWKKYDGVFGGGHKPPCQNCNGRSGKSDRTR